MELILLQKVANLGNIGDRVRVKSGYGRNHLLPKGKATLATPQNIARFEARRAELERSAHDELARAQQRAETLKEFKLTIAAKAGSEGKLFGSVTNIDIERALREKGFVIERRKIHLAEPIKQLGEFTVPVRLQPEVEASLKVEVKAE